MFFVILFSPSYLPFGLLPSISDCCVLVGGDITRAQTRSTYSRRRRGTPYSSSRPTLSRAPCQFPRSGIPSCGHGERAEEKEREGIKGGNKRRIEEVAGRERERESIFLLSSKAYRSQVVGEKMTVGVVLPSVQDSLVRHLFVACMWGVESWLTRFSVVTCLLLLLTLLAWTVSAVVNTQPAPAESGGIGRQRTSLWKGGLHLFCACTI